mmetsp:Transcript_31349/g.50496  ORF Transcript_31349/g.50496 Transcript_31349/m.50496 type:complete len:292 (-) Transcript_31349:2959-3834(-)
MSDLLNLKIVKNNPKSLCVLFYHCDTSFTHAIKNIVENSIITLAADTIMIFENTSNFNDEFIAHRIGLIPLISNTLYEACNWEKNPKIVFDINKFCKNNSSCFVSTKDYRCNAFRNRVTPIGYSYYDKINQENKFNLVNYSHILILKLKQSQVLSMKITLKKGKGSDHTKWCSNYGNILFPIPTIRWNLIMLLMMDKMNTSYLCDTLLDIVNITNIHHNQILNSHMIENLQNSSIHSLFEFLKSTKIVKFGGLQKTFFKFESNGSLLPKYILIFSMEALVKRLDCFVKTLS